MAEKIGKYLIALLPDDKTTGMVEDLRSEYLNIIEIPKTPIHLTLKESFWTSGIKGLIAELESAYQNTSSLDVVIEGYDIFSGNTIVLKARKTPELQSMHNTAINISKRFDERRETYSPKESLTRQQEAFLKEYNNPYVLKCYNPHITVGRILDSVRIGDI